MKMSTRNGLEIVQGYIYVISTCCWSSAEWYRPYNELDTGVCGCACRLTGRALGKYAHQERNKMCVASEYSYAAP